MVSPRRHLGARLVAAAGVIATATSLGLVVPQAEAAPRPDLTVVRTTAPAKAMTGKNITVRTKVRNAGLGRAAATSVEYYLSKNAKKDRGDRKLPGSARLKALIGGVSWDVSAKLRIPSGTAPGSYYVIACVARDAGPARNDCKAPGGRTKITAPAGPGFITGDLTFTDTADTAAATWDRTATVGIQMAVTKPGLRAEFADRGSRYSWSGAQTNRSDCRTEQIAEEGAGGFKYSGDPYTDDIHGHWAHVSRSSLRIGLFLYYDHTDQITTCNGSYTETGRGLNVVSIRFEQVSRTATSITYRAESWEEAYGGTSNWDDIDGTITFELKKR